MRGQGERTYIAIDLKSFYASVECVERGLDAMTTNLVVADASRTSKTICLAVTPALKAHGVPGRARLFEAEQRVREINEQRKQIAAKKGLLAKSPEGELTFRSSSFDAVALANDPSLELSFIIAPPRMNTYMEYSTRIFSIYLQYVSEEDIHVYSCDECFIDVTGYLKTYAMSARDLAMKMIREVLFKTGITATGGVGTSMYLAKVAMDIVAKHIPADQNGVRIAELDERTYREQLWSHRPLTDFWQVGKGIRNTLEDHGIMTMGDIARCSIGRPEDYYNEELLYRLFGKRAELLIDHAWGWEPTTIRDIKQHRTQSKSLSSGQVLAHSYPYEKGALIVREMTELLVLSMVSQGYMTNQVTLTVVYDTENVADGQYIGEIVKDFYGRLAPRPAFSSMNIGRYTSSTRLIAEKMLALYRQIVDPTLSIRRVYVVVNNLLPEEQTTEKKDFEQLDLFTDYDERERRQQEEAERDRQEKKLQLATLSIQKRFGKNALLKGMNFEDGGTTIERNGQVGGHKSE